ncbi:MAG: AI-2E family transporter [Lentimonas sp.]
MSSSDKPFLSPAQKRIVAAGGTALAAVFLIATCFYLFILLKHFVTLFKDVLLALAIAAILATLVRPIITFCETKTFLSRVSSIILLYALVLLVLAAAATFFLPSALAQSGEFLQALPALIQKFLEYLKGVAPSFWEWLHNRLGESPETFFQNIMEENTDGIKNALIQLQSSAGSTMTFMAGLFGKIAAYSIIPVYLFFILNGDRDVWKDLQNQLTFLPKDRRDDLIFLGKQFSEILVAFFRGQIIVGLLLGLVLSIGFGIVGLKMALVLGFVLGLLNIIPYLGTMLGIVIVLPLAYFQEGGGTPLIVACAVVFVIGQLLTDYVFTPRVMGEKTGMGPMLIIFSVFFWGTALSGLLGMILAIPLTAFFVVFWRLARDKYLPALVARKESERQAS